MSDSTRFCPIQNHCPDLVIDPVDQDLFAEAQIHIDALTKPQGSLGRLEEIARRLFAIAGGRTPLSVTPAICFTVAADHGVARQRVSAYPQSVTRQMVVNFLNGGGAINCISQETGMTLCLVDAGCCGGSFPACTHPSLLDRRLGDGTKDFTKEPAMTEEQAIQGIVNGIHLVREAAEDGCQCTAIGEMGIGNTTAATAIYCALFGLDPMAVTGPGTGLAPHDQQHKATCIAHALSLHADALANRAPLAILSCLGGFEIATMTGILLGSASEHLPVLVDGFIATASYALAIALAPDVASYAFLTHHSAEPGYAAILSHLPDRPLLDLGLRLGEGTGCAMSYPLFRAAAAIYNTMATFSKANVATKTISSKTAFEGAR